MSYLSIGQLAKQAKTSIDTLRFYERIDLIAPAYRKPSGYRQYTPDMIGMISFIQRAKNLGFTLVEIKDLLSLRQSQHARAFAVKEKASEKISKIDRKIQELVMMRNELFHLATTCDGSGSARECPILEGISSSDHS